MLRHIVMLSFKERAKVNEISKEFKMMLMGLERTIPELIRMEVGLNINQKATAYDLVLTADFKDENALNIYRDHVEHMKVLDYMRKHMDKVAVVDYLL